MVASLVHGVDKNLKFAHAKTYASAQDTANISTRMSEVCVDVCVDVLLYVCECILGINACMRGVVHVEECVPKPVFFFF